MKISKAKLKQIINEEIRRLSEVGPTAESDPIEDFFYEDPRVGKAVDQLTSLLNDIYSYAIDFFGGPSADVDHIVDDIIDEIIASWKAGDIAKG